MALTTKEKWGVGVLAAGVVGIGALLIAKTAKASTGPSGPSTTGGCSIWRQPSKSCDICDPSEVNATVAIANDPTKSPGDYNVFAKGSGRNIMVHKPQPGFGWIMRICMDQGQSPAPNALVI